MWPKGTRTSIDAVESHSPLVRVVREEDWMMLMDELRDLRRDNASLRLMVDGLETCAHEERAAVVAWLRQTAGYYDICTRKSVLLEVSHTIERGYHRRFEEAP